MAKAEATVEELVSKIERGELRLPEMQRRYVWRSSRVRDLLDSLYRGYPSGAILIWETDERVAAYIPELFVNDGDQAFTSECIPTDPSLLTPERYRDFLAEQRRLIVVRLNDFLAP